MSLCCVSHFIYFHYECHYAECHYGGCHYSESCGALEIYSVCCKLECFHTLKRFLKFSFKDKNAKMECRITLQLINERGTQFIKKIIFHRTSGEINRKPMISFIPRQRTIIQNLLRPSLFFYCGKLQHLPRSVTGTLAQYLEEKQGVNTRSGVPLGLLPDTLQPCLHKLVNCILLDNDKQYSLLLYEINYKCNMFYSVSGVCSSVKRFQRKSNKYFCMLDCFKAMHKL